MKGITHFFATGYFTLESGPATQSKSRRCATFAVSIAVHAAGFIAPIVLASAVMQLFSVWEHLCPRNQLRELACPMSSNSRSSLVSIIACTAVMV